MGRINTTTEQDLQQLEDEYWALDPRDTATERNIQRLEDEYRRLLPKDTAPGLFAWFTTPTPPGVPDPYVSITEAQQFIRFTQETLFPHKNHPQAHLLWDITAILYYLTPTTRNTSTQFLNDADLTHDLRPLHQQLTQLIHIQRDPYTFRRSFDQPLILLNICHTTPGVSLLGVWLYYQHTLPTWGSNLYPMEEIAFNLFYEYANTQSPPRDRGALYQRLQESLWVELFTTPTTEDGSRRINPNHLMDWENHPNWGTYQHITTQDPAPTITYPTPVANRTGRLLLNSPHTEHLLWYTTTHPGPTPAHQRLETMPHDVFIEWVLATNKYTNHEFNVTHRLLARWAGITDSSSDKDKAAVTMLALTIHDRITNIPKPGLPGPLLVMLHETPPFLDLPVTVQDTILNQYLTPINSTITLNPTTGHTVS